jgi:hypothetical protein
MSPDIVTSYPKHLPAWLCREEHGACFMFSLPTQTDAQNLRGERTQHYFKPFGSCAAVRT